MTWIFKDVILGQPAAVCLAKRQENIQRIPNLMPGIYLCLNEREVLNS